ncbi:fumarylacetoacetate hydrolase family protein [Alteraurantiacibacter palmitatis]|uniref:Fumarylacetoacetate hydrolase family protein n=1 Tax=Alteraurantiacibacter palmitatis TaxID=2054628 RepID=A0ABV7E3V2_9SPHN
MKLASRANGTPDGELLVVSADGTRGIAAGPGLPNLREALERWGEAVPLLADLAAGVEMGTGEPLDPASLMAPLPRAWQWLDASAFKTHADLMQVAFGHDPIVQEKPLMYQGMSHRFYGPRDDVPFPDAQGGIDFEGEFAVVTDFVPMGTSAADAAGRIRLVLQVNDWSLRHLAVPEMKTGFGWVQAKPACSAAPFAVTPHALGDGWQDGRVCLDLQVDWNGARFGAANGREMTFGFHDLIAHAAATRDLAAGTIIGSGTVANRDYARVGSSCISERRAIEMIASGGAPVTGYMKPGDRVRMAAVDAHGAQPFGEIDQRVICAD